MNSQKVLLRKDQHGRYHEIGIVLEQQGKLLRVGLPDGTTVDHERSQGEVTPDRGSFIHLLRLDPAAVRQALAERPTLVYKRLLLDAGKAMSARQMKDKLGDHEAQLVDESWTKAKPALESDADVVLAGTSTRTYRCTATSLDAFDSLFPFRPRTTSPRAEASPAPATSTLPPQDPAALQEDVDGSPSPEPREAPQTEVTTVAGVLPSPEAPSLLLTRLTPLLERRNIQTLGDLAANGLALGEHVRKLTAPAQAALVEDLSPKERRLLALSAGPAKDGLLSRESQELTIDEYVSALGAAINEVSRRIGESSSAASLLELLDRAQQAGTLPAPLLIRLSRSFGNVSNGQGGLQRTLELLARHLRAGDSDVRHQGWDMTALSRAAASLPLTRTGGRTTLLVTLYSRDAAEARQPRWWEGVTFGELADAGRGPLAEAMADDEISSGVVAPAVAAQLGVSTTRSSIALLWTLPPVLGEHVTGERMASLISDLASRDAVAAGWHRALANVDRLVALETEVESLAEAGREVEARSEQHARKSEQLRDDLHRAADELAASRRGAADDRSAHDRQIKIDLLRTLALLTALVRQSAAARSDEALMRIVDHTCHREGLEPFSEVGDTAPFDPAVHEALDHGLAAQSPTTVVRGGYTWLDGEEIVVLLRPQVVAVRE